MRTHSRFANRKLGQHVQKNRPLPGPKRAEVADYASILAVVSDVRTCIHVFVFSICTKVAIGCAKLVAARCTHISAEVQVNYVSRVRDGVRCGQEASLDCVTQTIFADVALDSAHPAL